MKLLVIFIWLVYILSEVFVHEYIIEVKKKRPFYLHFFLQRGIAAILHGVLYLWLCFEAQGIETSIKNYLPLFVIQVSSFWILFDLGLNLLRGKDWWYKGKNSGWVDRLSVYIYWPLKTIALITALIIIVKFLQN